MMFKQRLAQDGVVFPLGWHDSKKITVAADTRFDESSQRVEDTPRHTICVVKRGPCAPEPDARHIIGEALGILGRQSFLVFRGGGEDEKGHGLGRRRFRRQRLSKVIVNLDLVPLDALASGKRTFGHALPE